MSRQNYVEILNRLGGLNSDELTMLQRRLEKMIASETTHKGATFKKRDGRYVEVKIIYKTLKSGEKVAYYYKYHRWWEKGKLKSEYIGKASDKEVQAFLKTYRPRQPKPAQPKAA
jgi:hypothetical protein